MVGAFHPQEEGYGNCDCQLRVRKRHNKFGINIPTTMDEAKKIDRENGNEPWQKSIAKEMYEVGVAFRILGDREHIPVGYSQSSGHLVFEVKIDFTCKAR